MVQRLDYMKLAPKLAQKLTELTLAVKGGGLDEKLLILVEIRASQINGCAFCLDLHVKDAKIHGERELRLHHVAIWHESPLFDLREKAALGWTEVLTRLAPGGVPPEAFDELRLHFTEKEIAELTYMVMAINAWNRLAIAFTPVPGSADLSLRLDKAGLA